MRGRQPLRRPACHWSAIHRQSQRNEKRKRNTEYIYIYHYHRCTYARSTAAPLPEGDDGLSSSPRRPPPPLLPPVYRVTLPSSSSSSSERAQTSVHAARNSEFQYYLCTHRAQFVRVYRGRRTTEYNIKIIRYTDAASAPRRVIADGVYYVRVWVIYKYFFSKKKIYIGSSVYANSCVVVCGWVCVCVRARARGPASIINTK